MTQYKISLPVGLEKSSLFATEMMRSNTICDWAKSQNIDHHTMCLDEDDSLCSKNNWDHESRIFDADDKKLVVDLHNKKRQKVVLSKCYSSKSNIMYPKEYNI